MSTQTSCGSVTIHQIKLMDVLNSIDFRYGSKAAQNQLYSDREVLRFILFSNGS